LIKIDDRSKKQGLKKGENIMRVKRLVSLALAGMLAASVALTGCGSKKEATTSDGKTIVKIGTQQMPNDEGIAKAMKAKKIIYAGTYKKPENKKLMKSKCDLAILSNKILPDEKNEKKMSVEDQQKRYEELAEKFVLLDVPMIVDRSADEEKDDAKAEWSKVYEAIFAQTDSTDSSAKN